MDGSLATLACCLLALSFAVTQPGKGNLTTIKDSAFPSLTNLTITSAPAVTSSNVTLTSHLTGNTTLFTSTTQDNETFTRTTAATTESTSHLQTSQSAPTVTSQTNSTPPMTAPPNTYTPTATTVRPATQTAGSHTSTSVATVITTNSSLTVNTSSDSPDRTTQALQLDMSEKSLTIFFSIVLGVLAVALVVFMLHQCKQKIQFLHQPLNNSDDMDAFVADDDTLVISGGLYDGHPIHENEPEASADQSQLRLEFLHQGENSFSLRSSPESNTHEK